MLKDKFANLESSMPHRKSSLDLEAVEGELKRLRQFASSMEKAEKRRTAPSLAAALQPTPRQATRSSTKQDILHIGRLAGRNRGIQNVLVKVAETAEAPTVLADLAGAARSEVRMAVADNAYTPCGVKAGLAKDNDVDIRFALAENHGTPLEVLQSLQEDQNPYVAERAKKTLERLRMKHLLKGEFAATQMKKFRRQA